MTLATRRLTFCAALVLAASPAFAQAPADAKDVKDPNGPAPLSALEGRPDVVGGELLGGTFQSTTAGIAFRTPANLAQVKSQGEEIARFQNEKKQWELIVTRSSSDQPMPLAGGAGAKMGLLEVVAARLKQNNPGIDVARQEVVNLGEYDAAIVAARLGAAGKSMLHQQALIQANDQLYYTLTLVSPAAKGAKGADSDDPAETEAVESFRQVLDSVKLLDRGQIKDDQNQRLYRTRALLVNNLTPERLKKAMIPEQWLRLMRDGRDIGYSYIVEEPDGANNIKIGIRSRSYPDTNTQVDGETWYIVTTDRSHENWSNLVWVQDLKKKAADQFSEVGSSDRRVRRINDNALAGADGQPGIRHAVTYTLNVQAMGKNANAEPVKRELPPFYLPQALGHLLPRLVPVNEPKTFLFATYVGDRREVMMRYVDVGNEQEVDLAGQRVRAVPITDRIGLEGSPTIHYIDPAGGKYLGSVNRDSKITILPSDAVALQKIWENKANLTRPKDVPVEQQQPQQPQARTGPQ